MAVAAPPAPSRWLYGPVSDIALGSGLLYVPIFAVLVFTGSELPFGLMPVLSLAIFTPHIGATLLRVYECPEDRRAYGLFTVWATIAIAVPFIVGLYVTVVGSVLITIYLTVVPWHFTAQNYGVALIFLRRSGIGITPELKRYLYAAFILPFILWILALHAEAPATAEYAPLGPAGTVYEFFPAGIPTAVQGPAVILLAVLYIWVIGECLVRLLKLASLRDVLPGLALMLTQGLWFVAPILSRIWLTVDELGPLAPGSAGHTFIWISACHGVQYLWITSYYARKEQPATRMPRYLVKSLLAGAAFLGFPLLLLAPGVLGRLSYDAGLYLMLAGALGTHHVMLDSVIWKLRNTRLANILIQGAGEDRAPIAARRSWLGPLVWASGVVSVVFLVAGTIEGEFGVKRAIAQGDLERLEASATRMTWMGRDNGSVRSALGTLKLEAADPDGALQEFERSLALHPTPVAWVNVGVARERNGRLPDAFEAYETALELDPEDVNALYYAGRASLLAGDLPRARELLEKAAGLAPERTEIRRTLDAALRRDRSL